VGVDASQPLGYKIIEDVDSFVYDIDNNGIGEYTYIYSRFSHIDTFDTNTKAIRKNLTYVEEYYDEDESGVYEHATWEITTNMSKDVAVEDVKFWTGTAFTFHAWDFIGQKPSVVFGEKDDLDEDGKFEDEWEYYDLWNDRDENGDPTHETVSETHGWMDYGLSVYNTRKGDTLLVNKIGQTFKAPKKNLSTVGFGITRTDLLSDALRNAINGYMPENVQVSLCDKVGGNWVPLATETVPFKDWNATDSDGFTWVDISLDNLVPDHEYAIVASAEPGKLLAVNQTLNGYDGGETTTAARGGETPTLLLDGE
jgi:hypothetical protein